MRIAKVLVTILFVSVCLVALNACSSLPKHSPGAEQMNTFTDSNEQPAEKVVKEGNWIVAKVEKQIDGDTMVISNLNVENVTDVEIKQKLKNFPDELTVRYLAVDTPEITKGKNELYGQEGKELVEQLLGEGKVKLEIDSKALFDNYDRLLAHVFTPDGTNVQLSLLETGLARTAYLFDEYNYIDEYKAAETRAKEANLHIHSIEGYSTDDGFNMEIVNGNETLTLRELGELSINDMIKMLEDLKLRDISEVYNLLEME